jgi:hypothetical protein
MKVEIQGRDAIDATEELLKIEGFRAVIKRWMPWSGKGHW